MEIKFSLPEKNLSASLSAEIVWIKQKDNKIEAGLKIKEMDQKLKEEILDWLSPKWSGKNSDKEEKEFLELKKKAISIVERYESEAARKTSLLPNVLKTLKTLREMKLKMAVCTTNGEKSTSYILKRFHITHFFEAVITRESVSAVKPDPAHLEAALKALKIRPE